METIVRSLIHMIHKSSYRTYEEWKRLWNSATVYGISGSYRTYEEWKQEGSWEPYKPKSSSYRTYEEWKRHWSKYNSNESLVLTVPMRNGNLIVTSVKSLDEF